MKRVVLVPEKIPEDVLSRIMDRGAIYPNDHYSLSFNTAYKVDFLTSSMFSEKSFSVNDETGDYNWYPFEWFKLV